MQNTSDLDRFDQAILATLAEGGRISITDLAKRIGLSKSPTQARLRRPDLPPLATARAFATPSRMKLISVPIEAKSNPFCSEFAAISAVYPNMPAALS